MEGETSSRQSILDAQWTTRDLLKPTLLRPDEHDWYDRYMLM